MCNIFRTVPGTQYVLYKCWLLLLYFFVVLSSVGGWVFISPIMSWDWFFCCSWDLLLLFGFVTQKAIWLAHWLPSFHPSTQPPIQAAICTFIHSTFIEPHLLSVRQWTYKIGPESYSFFPHRAYCLLGTQFKKKKKIVLSGLIKFV